MMSRTLLDKILYCAFFGLVLTTKVDGSNLDGTASPVYKNQHHVFSNGEIAKGFVRLNNGFTILPGARATMDTVVSVSGPIDLRRTGRLQLVTDLQLDSGVTLSSGGYLGGRGYTLDFSGSFTIPRSEVLHIISDTVIDGHGGTLFLDSHANLFIEQDVTLTLRNLFVRSKINSPFLPPLVCGGNSARLALDNVGIKLTDDFVFLKGQLFVHRDVFITGTNHFVYKSPKPLFIDNQSILAFDIGTSFTFAPTSTDQKLLVFKDATSGLYLNGSTFNTTSTGVRLTKGSIFVDNKVIFNTATDSEIADAQTLTSSHFGGFVDAFAWRPDGHYLVIGGTSPNPNGINNTNRDDIFLYKFDGSTLITVTSQSYGEIFSGSHVFGLDWSPDGQYLAVGGDSPSAGRGGFNNTDNVRVYRFDGSFLVPVTSVPYINYTSDTTFGRWSPDQQYLLVGGESGGVTGNTYVYKFDGVSLTLTTSRQIGSLILNANWSPDGKFVAVSAIVSTPGGSSGFPNIDAIKVYSFNGSVLTPITSQPFGPVGALIPTCNWSPDGKFLLLAGSPASAGVGGFANADLVRIYAFNGTSLMPRASHPGGFVASWSRNGKYLSYTLSQTGRLMRLMRFDGSTISDVATFDSGSGNYNQGWDPSNKVFTAGFSSIELYKTPFSKPHVTLTNGVVLGDSASGSSFDCHFEALGGAHVCVNGILNDDSF